MKYPLQKLLDATPALNISRCTVKQINMLVKLQRISCEEIKNILPNFLSKSNGMKNIQNLSEDAM